MSGLGPLADGGRVVVIGGGPGGVGCALALQRLASQAGRNISVTILEGKQFSGQRHHNLSTGVLTAPLPTLMDERLGMPFPRHLALGEITGYVLHTPRQQIRLEDPHDPAITVHRVQFDQYMLDTARERGISVLRARATDIDFHDDCAVIYTESQSFQADAVVGAFGMDDGSSGLFARSAGYRPPQALGSVLTHIYPGQDEMRRFGPDIHAFLRAHPGVDFGAITPKSDHLTINIAGTRVGSAEMAAFFNWPEVRALLPRRMGGPPNGNGDVADEARPPDGGEPNGVAGGGLTGGLGGGGPRGPRQTARPPSIYKWRFPCSLAHHYYGDRFVMVGDAAGLVRAFKGKGVTTAVLTGIRAADTIIRHGISARAFAADYAEANRDITDDLFYGRLTRHIVLLTMRLGLMDPIVRAARRNEAVRESLFGAVSGHDPYRHILAGMMRPQSIFAVLAALPG